MEKVQDDKDKQVICSEERITPLFCNPTTLMLESHEIDGARKLLLKLQQDYQMSLIPSVKCRCKSGFGACEPKEGYEYFPIQPKYRKVVGEGMMRFLLTDKENIRKYVYEDCDLEMRFEHDKKGKPVRCYVSIIENNK